MEEKGKGRQVREEGKAERREAEATYPEEGLRERQGREREHRQVGTAQARKEAGDPLGSAVEGGDWEWVGPVS